MGRTGYFVRRLAVTVLLVMAVATAIFLFFRLIPGDYATMLVQSGASQENVEMVREQWGLNEPLHVQYLTYMENLVTGNLGVSRDTQEPVLSYVIPPLINSMILALPAIIVAYLIGSVYGAVIGGTENSRLEKYGILPPTVFGTTPDFFVGMILIYVFASQFNLFPTQGMLSIQTYSELGQNPSYLQIFSRVEFWHHYFLPFSAIVLKQLYLPTMVMRGSVVETSGQEFSYFHRITGLSKSKRFRRMMKHASLPVITLLPTSTARSLSGLVLIEIVFNWPGIGSLLLSAVGARDTPVVQFMFVVIAMWIILGNFLVDIFYTIIDPRITIGESG